MNRAGPEGGGILFNPEDGAGFLDLKQVFNRDAAPRLEVDLGCGKGRFLLARAQAHPATCFLGIDRRYARIAKVERKVVRLGLANVRLIYGEAAFAVRNLLPDRSVAAYYLFFSDPWPKRRHHRRRLFDANFLAALRRTLVPGGLFHAATDHLDYFADIRGLLAADSGFRETEPYVTSAEERTDFELVFLAQMKPIGRCSFIKTG